MKKKARHVIKSMTQKLKRVYQYASKQSTTKFIAKILLRKLTDETLLISSKSEYADKTEILDVLKMIDDIEDFTFYKYVGVSEEGETYVKLLFPATSSDFLILYGSYNIKDRMYFKLPKINVLFGVEPTE